MGEHKLEYIEANGIRFAYFEQGKGPLVICLHGFPDTPRSFDALLSALAEQGYRAVAPFMRGYHPSSLARDGDYSIKTLAEDVLALVDVLDDDGEAILVGHDWGGIAAYLAANLAPEKIKRLVVANVPHLRRFPLTLAQIRRSWYIIFFQLPWLPEKVLPRNDFAFLHRLYRAWSPNWAFTEADIEPVKNALTGGGRVKAALGYYRAFVRGLNKASRRELSRQTTVPTLVIAGESDGSIGIELFNRIRDCFVGELDFQAFEAVGHFPQREIPDSFNRTVLAFLQ